MKRCLPFVFLLVAVAAIWLVCAAPSPLAVDVLADQSLTVADMRRQYTLVVPRTLASHPPLVFAFHGTGDTPQSMAAYTQFNTLASQHGFVLVYPATAGSHWDTRPGNANTENLDLLYFDCLLAHLISQRGIDARRVYAIGMSNGATFAQLLAARRSQQVAGVVAHSGTPPPPIDPSPERTSPTMHIVGDLDPVHDSVVSHAVQHDMPHISVSGLTHHWSARHNVEMWQFLSKFTTPTKE